MTTAAPVPRRVVTTTCLLLVVTATVMAASSLALAADGSYHLVRILEAESFFSTDSRLLGNVLRQTPVVLAVRAGLTDTHLLSILLGVGQLVVPVLVWCAAITLSRIDSQVFVAVAMTAGLCIGATWFFNVSESALAVALLVLVAVLLWDPRPWGSARATLAVGACVPLLATYESTMVTGPVIAVWAAWRGYRARSAYDRYGCFAMAIISALGLRFALSGTTTGPGPSGARSSLYFVASGYPWQYYVTLAMVAVTVLGLLVVRERRARRGVFATGAVLATVAITLLPASSVASFQARGGVVVAGLALVLLLWVLWARDRRRPRRIEEGGSTSRGDEIRWATLVPVVFIGAMAIASIRGLADWSQSFDAFRAEVDRTSGVAVVDDVLPPGRRDVVWDWTSSSLSLIVRRDERAGILIDPEPSFVPFPPSTAHEQLPAKYAWRR